VYGFVRDPETNEIFGWAEDGFVFDIETRRRKIFALRGSDLYSLNDEFLNLHLGNSDGSDLRMSDVSRPEVLAKLRKLLDAAGNPKGRPLIAAECRRRKEWARSG